MALVSAATLREYLPEISGTDADTELNNLIARVEASVARYLGFVAPDSGATASLDENTYTVYLDGPMKLEPEALQLPMRPIVTVASVHTDPDREYGSSTEIANTQYDIDKVNGRLILKSDSTEYFDTGYRFIKVVYNAGYDNSSPPAELVHAICLICSAQQRSKAGQGFNSLNARSVAVTYTPRTAFPKEARELLAGFRNAHSIF